MGGIVALISPCPTTEEIFKACSYDQDLAVVQKYIKRGGDVNILNAEDNTLLLMTLQAITNSSAVTFDVLKELVNAKADVNFEAQLFQKFSNIKYRPLQYAIHTNSTRCDELCLFLIDAGADIHHKDDNGRSLLFHAMRNHAKRGGLEKTIAEMQKRGAQKEGPEKTELELKFEKISEEVNRARWEAAHPAKDEEEDEEEDDDDDSGGNRQSTTKKVKLSQAHLCNKCSKGQQVTNCVFCNKHAANKLVACVRCKPRNCVKCNSSGANHVAKGCKNCSQKDTCIRCGKSSN